MSEEWTAQLEARFAAAARGRRVFVKFEPKDFILPLDYQIALKEDTNAFEVTLRRGGCFEGAYRCVGRFIESKAEELDGINSTPSGHIDLRRFMQYWMLEKIYEQFRLDLESAVTEKVSWLENVRPGDGVLGEVVIEARTRSLIGLLAHLQHADFEVRRGVLSPHTIELLKSIGLDAFSEVS